MDYNYQNYNYYNYPNDVSGQFGLRDKIDQATGMDQTDPEDVQITTIEHTLTVDTRDCIGQQSLLDAQAVSILDGIRDSTSGNVLNCTGFAVSPITVTLDSVLSIRDGDNIIIQGIVGNKNANGSFIVSAVTVTASPVGTVELNGTLGSGNYNSAGNWYRPPDTGFPTVNSLDSVIVNNEIIVNLNKPLKNIRTLALFNIVIPRDIIPLQIYISDFIQVSTNLTNIIYPGTTQTNYETFIPQESEYMTSRLLGFYSSPLDLWRSYFYGSMSMQDQVTPPPMQLWNPLTGAWPLQPVPYPFQTVPTYRSADFAVPNQTGFFHIVLSGYGVYDLLDWTANTGNPVVDSETTSSVRKLLLLLLAPKQSYRNVDYVNMIINSNTVTPGDLTFPFGYGSFQRFIPGPGLQLNYQPGTNILYPADPTVASADSPIAFPNFRGNVWGPYNGPESRFQKLGSRTLIQDLYLNGDLSNLAGDPIINPAVPTENLMDDPAYGLNFQSLVEVNLGNIGTATNPNITNAMRISSNGFGAAIIRANGSGTYYQNVFGLPSGSGGAGGQGPSTQGPPNSWVNHGVISTGSYLDPIAQGPSASNITPSSADASYSGTGIPDILYQTSFNDAGPNSGQFINSMFNYINYAINEIPDTDLIIRIEEADRTIRAQSTNTENGDALLDCPVRLSLGSTNGTQQYIESTPNLVASSSAYWEKRYMLPLGKLEKLHIKFYSYAGDPIPLERMLQQRRSLQLQRLTIEILNELNLPNNPFSINYLFNPLNPQLIGRLRRYFQIIFKISCYEGISPGLNTTSYQGITPYIPSDREIKPYM